VLLILSGLPLAAQSTTAGSLSGTVTDSTGAALPGVTVELSGVAMQGTRSVVTDSNGAYRFVNVPVGENYKVVANLSGFQPVTKTIARVYLGQDATVNLQLRAAVSESIVVTAEAPLVDVSKTTTGVNVTARQFESLPTARTFQQLTTMAPGVNIEMGTSRDNQLANSPNVGASSAPENNYIIDGLSTTDARYGTSGTNLTMNFVEEVQVMTGGYSAEYGRSTGGVFNVITKSGGNDFRGDAFGYYSNKDWSEKRIGRFQKGTSFMADTSGGEDFGLSLGGPIMRDRLWFFGAFNPSRRTIDVGEASPLLGDAATEYKVKTNFYAAKLTLALTPNHSVVGTAFGDPTTQEGWLVRGITATAADVGAADRKSDIGSNNMNLRYNGVMSQNWLLEANLGQHKRDNNLGPDSDTGRTVARQIDETQAAYQRGGFQRSQAESSQRDAYSLKSTNFMRMNEIRYGLDVENNKYSAATHETWYRYFGEYPKYGANQGRLQERNYNVNGSGKTENQAAFFQDQIKPTGNLQINLGVRYERQKMSSARGVYTASNPEEVLDFSQHADSFTLDNNWAPRLGIVWDPMNNGRSKVYGYVGRFFEAVPLDLNIRALNGEDYIISYLSHSIGNDQYWWYNPAGNPIPPAVQGAPPGTSAGGWTVQSRTALTGATQTPLASDLKAQYQDEIILGGEYQFGSVWSGGLRLVDRELKRVIEDFGVFGDPTDPLALTGYAIGNPGEGALGKPFVKPERYYRAAEFTVQRAFRDNWQLYASYVYARAQGNYEGLFMSGYEQLDPNITAMYDIPSFLNNATGKLRADRPVNFKVHSSYRLPIGLTVSEGFYYSSGLPISAQGPEIYNGYGDGTIFLKPRGSEGRTPNFWALDLHADYAFPFVGNGRSLSAIVDVLNVTNQHAVLEVDQDYVYEAMGDLGGDYAKWFDDANLDANGNPKFNANYPASPYYKAPLLYQAPRTVQLGLKFTY